MTLEGKHKFQEAPEKILKKFPLKIKQGNGRGRHEKLEQI